MSAEKPPRIENRLLASLPRNDCQLVLAHCETIELKLGTLVCEPGRVSAFVYFPLGGFISLVTSVDRHAPLELGLIGNEGMLGATLALGVNTALLRGVVQGSGTALRLPAEQCRQLLQLVPALRATLGRYVYVLMAQLAQSAACLSFHRLDARLARWLLMTHDRAHVDHFHLTQNFLADKLGVRRSAVTIAAGELQRRALIRYSRGEIHVLARATLEAAACACYATGIKDYARMIS